MVWARGWRCVCPGPPVVWWRSFTRNTCAVSSRCFLGWVGTGSRVSLERGLGRKPFAGCCTRPVRRTRRSASLPAGGKLPPLVESILPATSHRHIRFMHNYLILQRDQGTTFCRVSAAGLCALAGFCDRCLKRLGPKTLRISANMQETGHLGSPKSEKLSPPQAHTRAPKPKPRPPPGRTALLCFTPLPPLLKRRRSATAAPWSGVY